MISSKYEHKEVWRLEGPKEEVKAEAAALLIKEPLAWISNEYTAEATKAQEDAGIGEPYPDTLKAIGGMFKHDKVHVIEILTVRAAISRFVHAGKDLAGRTVTYGD